ncbi:MAPEG family protein [Phenylobacterium sp.]|uniref:MAPEG family protein n=1 Tax=Phenylobacterium sp. TaxID=1871053 RepID=UPI0025FFA75F|nr:MAPEG family protein [Phenylobacterium sp.]MBX3484543.1 MAPEG family protein [Phenylobacterium sp.]MCW5761421.1 MAPEG family protein [Phenylobacterium sp.]
MPPHSYVAIVTLLALLVYFWMGLQVGRARGKSGIAAPAMTGDPVLERTIRAHYNTLEWLPLFLVPLWLFAIYWSDLVAAAVGLVWIVGRIVYQLGYVADPKKRELGFMIQALAVAVLLFGSLGRLIYVLAVTGGA